MNDLNEVFHKEQIADIKRSVANAKFSGVMNMFVGLMLIGCGITLIVITGKDYFNEIPIDSEIYKKYGGGMVFFGGVVFGLIPIIWGSFLLKNSYKNIRTCLEVQKSTKKHCLEIGVSYEDIKIF